MADLFSYYWHRLCMSTLYKNILSKFLCKMFNEELSISMEHMQKQVHGFRFSRRHQLTEVFIELETSDLFI